MTPLPGILAEIAEVAGTDAATALWQAKGGMRVSIPADEVPPWLGRIVGAEAAGKIVAHFRVQAGQRASGLRITIPLGAQASERQARRALAEALRSGQTPEQAAASAGMHVRTAYRMQRLLRSRRNSTQLELF